VLKLTQENGNHHVPSFDTARVMVTVHSLGTRNRLKAGINPIRRGSIGVSGIDAKIYAYEIGGNGDGDDNGGGSGSNNPSADRLDQRIKRGKQAAKIRFLGSEVQHLSQQISDDSKQAACCDALHRQMIFMMAKNIA
jgi:hypothetical protein